MPSTAAPRAARPPSSHRWPPAPGDAGRQAAARQAQGAGRLQDRGLCQRHRQRPRDDPGPGRHAVRRHPHRGQGLRGVAAGGAGREARDQDHRVGPARPNGVAFHDGALYVAELSKIWRYDDIEKHLDGSEKPTLVYDDLPKDEAHGWKFIAIGPDNKLYVPVGAPGNIVMPPDTHAQIRRIDLDGKNAEVIARGVRNTVGFDWNPKTKQLWFTDNGRDWVSEDIPNDELNVLTEPASSTSDTRTATRAPSRIRNTAGAIPARSSPHRRPCSGRTPPRWACGSTPARSSRKPTATRSSSPSTARGTAPPSSAARSWWPSPAPTARPARPSRS